MTRSGLAYELRTLELRTDETDGFASPSELLPTPSALESTPTEDFVGEVRENLNDPHKRLYLPGRKWHSQRTLSRIAPALLPTPGANDSTGAESETRDARRAGGKTGGPSLRDLPRLLPTPDTGESISGHGRRGGKAGNGRQSGQDLERTVEELLPTPTGRDGKGPNPNEREGGDDLPTAVKLLPTPVVTDSFGSRRSTARTEEWTSNPGTTLTDAIWEVQGRETDTQGKLLPTPTATYPGGTEEDFLERKGREEGGATHLNHAVEKLLPTPTAQELNPGAGGELRAAVVHGETRRSTSETDTFGRPIRKGREQALPTPRAVTGRSSRKAMVENRQWSAPSLEQAVEIAAGRLPREFESWDEVPGWSGDRMSPLSDDGSTPSDEPLPGQLTILDDSTPDSPSGCSVSPRGGSTSKE